MSHRRVSIASQTSPIPGRASTSSQREENIVRPPPVPAAGQAEVIEMNRYSGSSAPTTHTTSSVTSRGSMGSIGSRSGWSSGLSLVQGNDSAYGDYTGTKGFGTGNTFERAERPNAIPGVYGGSTGTKGFGTGNSFEDKRLRSSRSMASLQIPTRSSRPSDASSVRSRRSVGFGERVREIAGKVSSIAVPERELHAEPRSISVRA